MTKTTRREWQKKNISYLNRINRARVKTTIKETPSENITRTAMYSALTRKIGQANKRLRAIEKEYGSLGWSGTILKNKTSNFLVNTWRGAKGIKISEKTSEKELQATYKLVNNFLQSKTSTVEGIKKLMISQQKSIRENLSTEEHEVTKEESEALYHLFGDKDFSIIAEKIKPSDLFALLIDVKEKNLNKNEFKARIGQYVEDGQDNQLRQAVNNLWNKRLK